MARAAAAAMAYAWSSRRAPARDPPAGWARYSMPTERRSRSGGTGVPGPSIEARCSIRLSTPPSEVARFQSYPGRGRDRRRLAARDAERQHAAEAALHLARRDRVARMLGQARVEHLRDVRVARERSARNSALAEARATRRYSVRMPRSSSQASNGPRIAPASWRSAVRRCQKSSARAPTSAPATTSLWPFRYLVAECIRDRRRAAAAGSGPASPPCCRPRAGRRPMRGLGRGRDVGDRPGRVGRRLDPDELGGAGTDRRRERAPARSSRRVDRAPSAGRSREPVPQAPVHDLGATT